MRRHLLLLLAVGGLLTLVWLVLPPKSPPLYDGVQLPPPPYRYLNPPTNQPHTSKPPLSGTVVMTKRDVSVGGAFVNTAEPTPQARMTFDPGALALPPGTRRVVLTIRPIPPPGPLPSGTLDGNVYRYAAKTQTGAPISVRHGQVIRILLRGTGALGSPIIEQYASGHWRTWKTVHLLNTVYYLTQPTSFGAFALVFPGKGGTGMNYLPLAVVGAAVVFLMVAALLAVRLLRSRRPA